MASDPDAGTDAGTHDAGDVLDVLDVADLRDSLPDVVTVVCGDGVRGGDEQCDGTDMGSGYQVTCQDLGFSEGTLACGANCIYDTSGCVP